MENKALLELESYLVSKLQDPIRSSKIDRGELTIEVSRNRIHDVIAFLVNDKACQFNCFIDLCGVDYPHRECRFDVVYHLLSSSLNQRIRIKIDVDEDTTIDSITDILPGALWFEREAYDMFGIMFAGHPDLRRLLTDYGFRGYPLRKDFPLTGFAEVRYDETLKKVVYEPVKLAQEFRQFDYLSPWEGPDYLPGDEKASEH